MVDGANGDKNPSTLPGAPKSSTPTCGTVTRGEMTGDEAVAEIRDSRRIVNKAVDMAVGVDMEGIKHILGLWGSHQ